MNLTIKQILCRHKETIVGEIKVVSIETRRHEGRTYTTVTMETTRQCEKCRKVFTNTNTVTDVE